MKIAKDYEAIKSTPFFFKNLVLASAMQFLFMPMSMHAHLPSTPTS